jgi:hypothetical protein
LLTDMESNDRGKNDDVTRVAGRHVATVAIMVRQFNSINRRRDRSKKVEAKNDPDLRRNNEDKEVKVKKHRKSTKSKRPNTGGKSVKQR